VSTVSHAGRVPRAPPPPPPPLPSPVPAARPHPAANMAASWQNESAVAPRTFTLSDIEAIEAQADSNDAFAAVPEAVKLYLTYFHKRFEERNVAELHTLYEQTFQTISERYYKSSPWPTVEAVSECVNHDPTFLMLFNELRNRHLFEKTQPTLDQRLDSWNSYCELFTLFLKDGMIDIDLPASWLWDITDEFVYQFETWCQYRSKLKNKLQDEVDYLRDNDRVWNVELVLSFLHLLVNKSNIIPWLVQDGRPSGSSDPDSAEFDISTRPTYRYIGYFSIIGLLRVNTLLGDYRLALMVLQPLDFDVTTALFTHVTACHTSVYYYMGFCYIMLRRYEDAVRVFSSTVHNISRIKHNHTRSYQYEQINKRNDQMMSLLALSLALRPQHVDESVYALVRDKCGDRLARMRAGESYAFEDLFSYASPKFISPAPPDFNVIADTHMDAPKLQTRLFMAEVTQQLLLPEIRSFLKLYTTIEIEKLAKLMDVEQMQFRSYLHALKNKSFAIVGTFDDAPLAGKYMTSSDVGFHVERDVVHISDTKPASRHGEYFISQIGKLDEQMRRTKADDAAAAAREARHRSNVDGARRPAVSAQ
jgi:translation initiation factor 3 subunit L